MLARVVQRVRRKGRQKADATRPRPKSLSPVGGIEIQRPRKGNTIHVIPAEAEAFFMFRDRASLAQKTRDRSLKSFGRNRSRSLYHARPSLSAVTGAAVTRNVESLSDP